MRRRWLGCLEILLVPGIFISCAGEKSGEKLASPISEQELTEFHCGQCHLPPTPDLLPKDVWVNVLVQQRHFMGIRYPGENPYQGKGTQEGLHLEIGGIFPEEALVPDSTWHQIELYILDEAPDTLPEIKARPLVISQRFKSQIISPPLGGFPAVCMVDFDQMNHRIYIGDVNGFVAELDGSFEMTNFTQLRNPIVASLRFHDSDKLLLLDIGVLDPKDLPLGAIVMTDLQSFAQRALVFEELRRPVDFKVVDLDLDGKEDIVVCNFGHLIGDLSWYRNHGSKYEKIVLRDRPGAIKVEIVDWDGDQDKDIIVLFAHGDEGLWLFKNQGAGSFTEHNLIRFHPLYGCTDFQIKDINGDGDLDFVISNGDNSDGSQIVKPYHGIRIFENRGDNAFIETFFFAFPGAYKVLVSDFDLDDDPDLFAIAFYPNFEMDDMQSLVYLEQVGDGHFEASGFLESDRGRWMVADTGDLDQDGDQDIVIGSFTLGPGQVPSEIVASWHTSIDHLLFLENSTR